MRLVLLSFLSMALSSCLFEDPKPEKVGNGVYEISPCENVMVGIDLVASEILAKIPEKRQCASMFQEKASCTYGDSIYGFHIDAGTGTKTSGRTTKFYCEYKISDLRYPAYRGGFKETP